MFKKNLRFLIKVIVFRLLHITSMKSVSLVISFIVLVIARCLHSAAKQAVRLLTITDDSYSYPSIVHSLVRLQLVRFIENCYTELMHMLCYNSLYI